MKLLKKKTMLIALFLALILCLSFILPSFIHSDSQLSAREIDVDQIGTLS